MQLPIIENISVHNGHLSFHAPSCILHIYTVYTEWPLLYIRWTQNSSNLWSTSWIGYGSRSPISIKNKSNKYLIKCSLSVYTDREREDGMEKDIKPFLHTKMLSAFWISFVCCVSDPQINFDSSQERVLTSAQVWYFIYWDIVSVEDHKRYCMSNWQCLKKSRAENRIIGDHISLNKKILI